MRNLILFNMMTLDGFFEGPNADISWHNTDEEFNRFADEQLETAGMLVFGRKTYELMASYWPNAVDDPKIARLMNALPKLVFSSTMARAEWNNTRLVKDHPAAEIAALKLEPGKDLFLFGSARLASSLARQGLIDEFRIMLNPVILGAGTPLFSGITHPLRLNLTSARSFANGNVLLTYRPAPDGGAS